MYYRHAFIINTLWRQSYVNIISSKSLRLKPNFEKSFLSTFYINEPVRGGGGICFTFMDFVFPLFFFYSFYPILDPYLNSDGSAVLPYYTFFQKQGRLHPIEEKLLI